MRGTSIKRWDDQELVFKQPQWVGLLFALIGIGLLVGFYLGKVDSWIPYVIGGLFADMGIAIACYVSECRLDLVQRTYYRKKGFFLSPTVKESTFDDLRGLLFKSERRSSSSGSGSTRTSSSYTVWCIHLQWHDGDRISLGEWRDKLEAHNNLEEFAKKLNLPMIDATSGTEVVRSAEEADVTFREKAAEQKAAGEDAFDFPEPPADLKIDFSVEGKEIHFLLPRTGLGCASIFLGVFALLWNGIVCTFLVAVLSGNVKNAPHPLFMLLFLVPFVAVGIGLIFAAFYMARAQTHVLANPDHVTSYGTFLGKDWGIKTVTCAEIEEIGLHKASESSNESVYIRSDRASIDVGADLRDTDKRWLCDAIQAIVAA